MPAAGERLGRYQLLKNLIVFRGVAQLVARLVRDQEAVGSNPATSTNMLKIGAFEILSSYFVGENRPFKGGFSHFR